MRAFAGAVGLLLIPTLAACGGGASFPEPSPCATTVPAAATGSSRQAVTQYVSGVRSAVERLATLRENLRSEYPGEKFSRDSKFRMDFAAYADSTVCGSQNLQALRAPTPNFEQFDSNLDGAVQALIEHTQSGRAAVKARNVSDYRIWIQGVDAKIDAVRAASSQAGTR